MRFMSRLSFSALTSRSSPRRRTCVGRGRLRLEQLEDRTQLSTLFVVPLFNQVDATHFHSLAAAENAAVNGDKIQILAGASPEPGTISITKSGAIGSDPNLPPSNPIYNLRILASNVTLANINLGDVTVAAGVNHTTITRSSLQSFTETTSATGNGLNTLTLDFISGPVQLNGNTLSGSATSDVVANNVFRSTTGVLLQLENSSGTQVLNNSFLGADTPSQQALVVDSSSSVIIAGNRIVLLGPSATGVHVTDTAGPLGIQILNNAIDTHNNGTGLMLDVASGSQFTSMVQGNDFHGNLIGIDLLGDGSGGSRAFGTSDAGGVGCLGANDFRGIDGTTPGRFAIRSQNRGGASTSAQLNAMNNIFDESADLAVVTQDQHNGGQGKVAASKTAASPAFVQTLYNSLLGRTANQGELNFWVGVQTSSGAGAVVNGILRSPESLGRIVDGVYLSILGRQSDPGGRGFWVNQLQMGVPLETVQVGFVTSPEFISRLHVDYVQSLYQLFLGRSGSQDELAMWNNQLSSLGLRGVADALVHSTEHRAIAVTALYVTFLHRAPGNGELNSWVNSSLDVLTIQAALLSSPEYFSHG